MCRREDEKAVWVIRGRIMDGDWEWRIRRAPVCFV
jgi:hypothetical protein